MPLKNSDEIHTSSFLGVLLMIAARVSWSHHEIFLIVVTSGGVVGELDTRDVVGEISVKEVCPQPAVLTSKSKLVTVIEK